ncbi:MAG: type I restriction endonuclease subunit R [Calditrichaeota bacterium]|nr:type I restriction endonuclease subunit R [Calditrichota bacterium]MCB9367565.1 type I restriction endonuclease subunit R [Calditrichota bacterium]
MPRVDRTPAYIKIDEKNHVEVPFLAQLEGLGWDVIRLEMKDQKPKDTWRTDFSEVILEPVLRQSLKKINPWIEDDQVDDVIRRLTSYTASGLLDNNRRILAMLLENMSVSENRKTGDPDPTVRIIDFENRDNNSFIAVSQPKFRVPATEHHIFPDIVLFVNGLPVVLVECKSPKVKEPIPEAIDQMMRYSQQRGEEKEGVPQLFYFNQFIVATCRQQAKFGTITTHTERHFYRWTDPYPKSLNDLEHGASSPNDQQRLVAGMLDKDNLLSLIRTFTLFKTNDKGKLIKVVGRYQQFRAVKKAVGRLLTGTNRQERSGIIWHTQGSGKSLTMMFMVREMYRHPELSKWKVVFVTDRTQLEQQLRETSQSIGFTVKPADSIAKLKELLPTDSSDLIMAMIHKFQERELQEAFPELNTSQNVLVMTDEAHRSQYKLLGANLDRALPNATKIGYTGTPIDRTEQVFGDYIDKYTMREAIEDGVTLSIVYEGRTHNAEVDDAEAMDTDFQDVFSDCKIDERLKILGYSSRLAYLEAEPTITAKAKDMVKHYVSQVFPNGFKAQVVAVSQEAAVRYKKALESALQGMIEGLEKHNPRKINIERLKQLKVEVVISGGHNDLPHIKEHADSSKHKTHIKSFTLPFDTEDEGVKGDVGILVVMNMLITGFDAPIEQVMYLDRVITDHNLLQAIARVNRVGEEGKDKGFVVDYVGVGHHLKDAIKSYDEREQAEVVKCLSTPAEELNELVAASNSLKEMLAKHGLTNLSDHDAFFDLFYDEDVRYDYLEAFKKLTKSLNLVFPRKEALEYLNEYQSLSEINALAASHLNDDRLSLKGVPAKLRRITDAHLVSKGIEQKVAPISIFDDSFIENVKKRSRAKTKAAEVEHAIRHHIEVNINDDPELYASFAEALERIFQDFKDNWQAIFEELEKLRARIRNLPQPPAGLTRKKHMPFFRILAREIYGKRFGDDTFTDEEEDNLVELTHEVVETIVRETKLIGFWDSTPSQNRLEADLQGILLSERFSKLPNVLDNWKPIRSRLMEKAYTSRDILSYA